MSRLIDETGSKYGRLTVVKYVGDGKWFCKCECGNTNEVRGDALRSGRSRSCGCLAKESARQRRLLPVGDAAFTGVHDAYQRNAARRGLNWELSIKQFKVLTQGCCHYCGMVNSNEYGADKYNGSYIYNGIDRIDSSKGYIVDNVVPCCKYCNIAKNTMSQEEFMRWVKRIYEFNVLGGLIVI